MEFPVEIRAALGRNLSLGQLFDGINDRVLPLLINSNEAELKKCITVKRIDTTSTAIFEEDKLNKRAEALYIEGILKFLHTLKVFLLLGLQNIY